MQGVTYPVTIENGTLKLSTDESIYVERIFSVLETKPGERIERPEYGTPNYFFKSVSSPLVIPGRIEAALTDQIDGIRDFEVTGDINEDGELFLEIKYQIEQTTNNINLKIVP